MASPSVERFSGTVLADEIEFLLARARVVGAWHANKHFAGSGLKGRSYAVLSLAASDLEPTQRELAEFLSLDASQIVSLIDQLETLGFVERKPSPTDRRTNVIVVTPAGRQAYASAKEAARRAEDDAMAPLSASERRTLKALLSKVAF